jgi:hypothetical protein
MFYTGGETNTKQNCDFLKESPLQVIQKARAAQAHALRDSRVHESPSSIRKVIAFWASPLSGVEAGEIMGTVQVAMIAGLPYNALRDAVLTHPPYARGTHSIVFRCASNFPSKMKSLE